MQEAAHGDLAELEADLVSLDSAGGAQGLSEDAKAKINLRKGTVLNAIAALNLTTNASQNILSASGIQDSSLTAEAVGLGGDEKLSMWCLEGGV